jgi:small subunit ribosomal protein S7
MPPRLNVAAFARSIPLRPRPQLQWPARSALRFSPSQCRSNSDSKTSGANDRSKNIDAQPEGHVSEEAAKTAEIMGEQGPDMSKGTPIEEVRMTGSIGTSTSDTFVR